MKVEKPRLILLAADFNKAIVDAMIAAATEEATALGLTVVATARVQGCYELPLAAEMALARPNCDLLAVLGYIERGETLHGEVMAHIVCRSLIDLGLEHMKPIGIGIIGPGATLEQAMSRRDGHARNAVRAAHASLSLGKQLGA
jgi:6,7-dimethyl-8-ribityllumazine synthase